MTATVSGVKVPPKAGGAAVHALDKRSTYRCVKLAAQVLLASFVTLEGNGSRKRVFSYRVELGGW